VLDDGGHETTVRLTAGRAVIVPRGIWHRFEVHEPGELIAITAGEGTETRPV